MTTREKALAYGSIPIGVLVVAGVWELAQRVVDATKLRKCRTLLAR